MMRLTGVCVALLVCACASTRDVQREPFSLDALLANAPDYVAARYAGDELPGALIADLSAEGFECRVVGQAHECTRSQLAFSSCFDVWAVRLDPDAPVRADVNRRCLGALPGN